MQIHVYDTVEQVGRAAALLFAARVTEKPDSVLGLATGSSPLGCYEQLRAWRREGLLDFSKCVSFNLDEYCGLPEAHPCSYHAFMKEHLFDGVNLQASYLPDGNARDMAAECRRYDAAIRAAGGIDLQLLGIGRNGHIGFNEPGDRFVYGTHVVDLTPSTIQANRRFFESEDEVPRRAVSLGIGGIMAAREIVLIAMGEDKAQAVYDAVHGDVTRRVQASVLRAHPHTVFLLDREAAKKI